MSSFQQLKAQFPDLPWRESVLLAPFTYMKIGGPAEVLWEADQLDDLVKVGQFCRHHHLPVTVLGGASNVLIDDQGLPGLVILNRCDQISFWSEQPDAFPPEARAFLSDSGPFVMAEAGVKTASLVAATTSRTLTGLESFLGVPGTVGGALFNNSHYTEELIGDCTAAVEVLTPAGERQWLSQEECKFAYDASRFQKSTEIILRAIFQVQPGETTAIQSMIRATTVKRATTQPLGTANSGCMFQNVQLTPEQSQRFGSQGKLSAGWLIDQAGLKGTRVGRAVVSDVHANFIINEGGASSQEVEKLISLVQETVRAKFGVELQREVFSLGGKHHADL